MLRKLVVLAVSLAVVTGTLSAATARPSRASRVESGTYMGGGPLGLVGVTGQGQVDIGAVRFTPGPERFASFEIQDTSGGEVWGRVTQDVTGDLSPDLEYDFCTSTDKPVRITPNAQVVVFVYYGPCFEEGLSFPTSGTIEGTFSYRR